jgi:DNA polymerase I
VVKGFSISLLTLSSTGVQALSGRSGRIVKLDKFIYGSSSSDPNPKSGSTSSQATSGESVFNPSSSDPTPRSNTTSWLLGELNSFVDEVEGLLLDVRYDGRFNKAVAYLVDSNNRLVRWVDRTDHKPYFLTDAEPEVLASIGISSDNGLVVQFDVTAKFHPIRRERVKVTKVIVRDPLAVRKLRSTVQSKGYKVWEADIKYHHNYIYDNQLIPGMVYRVNRGWHRVEGGLDESYAELIESISRGESREYKDLVLEWALMFEQKPLDVKRVAVDVEIYSPEEGRVPDPEKASYPVISIALADNRGRVKILLLYRDNMAFEGGIPEGVEVEIFDDEISLLLEFFREVEGYPVVLTFNGDSFDIPYIYNRLVNLGVDPHLIPVEVHEDKVTFRHSLHVDLYKLFSIKALQVYAFGGRYRELTLDAIAEALLGIGKVELDTPVPRASLDKLIAYNVRDAMLTLNLTTFANNLVWNLVITIMRISKLGLEDVTRHQVSTWIRGLLNWEHRRRRWLIPSREELRGEMARSKAIIREKRYKGAIVLEPPRGVFFDVLVLDFASLYPSIIKNWNLSYETINNPWCKGGRKVVPEVEHEICVEFKGITSELVGLLRDFRVKVYKRRAKDESIPQDLRTWYDTVQAAMKVYINASYGVFGNEAFPFYSLPLAESVTAIGRSVLVNTLKMAEKLSLHIVYGDTDSLFIWDPRGESLEELIRYIEDNYGLELEVDKKFKVALFSGLKKNYLGVTDRGEVVIKGMVGKKSNTPEFIKEEFKTVVNLLGGVRSFDDTVVVLDKVREHIAEVYRKLKTKGYTLEELSIKVMLSKDPGRYVKTTPQHVKAAKLLEKEGVRVGKGDIIAFVKTRDSVGVKPVRLAKLSEVDANKYLEYVRTAFEQILLALGVNWEEVGGQKSLAKLLNLK